ncbi:EAL domain-containing protein [Ruminococcaceae bacterium OttesenSCG-928-L11]|nr:EAL domain-containing protein [Ruminococcaceae bacterium OttesenSCG-928-L11]
MRYFSYVENAALNISNNAVIKAIRKGLLYMMPLVLIGSFVLMFLNIPIAAFQNFMNSLFHDSWREIGLKIHNGTFQCMALLAVMSISYAYISDIKKAGGLDINPIFVSLTAFSSYLAYFREENALLASDNASSTGVFGAIIVAIVATQLFVWFYRVVPFRDAFYSYDSDTLLLTSLRSFLPALLTVVVFALSRLLIDISGISQFIGRIYENMSMAFAGSSGNLFSAIVFAFITNLLWFFGLHGTNILDGIARDLFVVASETNVELVAQGMAPTQILTKEFFDAFVYMGGCGCTMGLMIALLIAGRRSNINQVAKFSFFPGLFNINEMMVYGLPIIFNPYYLVPFLLAPIVLCITTYAAMRLGLAPLTIARVEWTTPVIMSGYVSTGSVAGAIMQLFNLAVSVCIYIPFIRLYERNLQKRNREVFEQLKQEAFKDERDPADKIINRNNELGNLARSLVSELNDCLHGKIDALHMEYQPKVSYDGRVVGAEALMRWEHPVHGYISPLVILMLCEEANLENRLGEWVLKTAFRTQKRWTDMGYEDIRLSANLSPRQLKDDEDLIALMTAIVKETKLNPYYMELELTENVAVDQSLTTRKKLEAIKDMGISISIDDFGMGNSSLLYLRDLYANVVKIDITLVRSINTDRHSQGIVHSIVQLCNELEVGLVAEGVEREDQLQKLHELGCDCYQGFYFSKSLRFDDFIRYVDTHNPPQ